MSRTKFLPFLAVFVVSLLAVIVHRAHVVRTVGVQETNPGSTGMAAQIPVFAGTISTYLTCNARSDRLPAINDAAGELWYCYGGTWKKLAAPDVTSVTGTSPIVSSGGQTPSISCPTCITTSTQQVQQLDFTNQPGLFATSTATANIYYEPNAVTIKALVTREQGSPICTAAPVAVILDLGTSASTAYGSATVLYSQTLSTSNTVASNTGLSVAVAAGHFIGYGFSAGTCVTPPTITSTLTIQ